MKFAKRHYEAIALAMQEVRRQDPSHSAAEVIDRVIAELADTFKADNGQFCRDRFTRACQPGANVRARG